MVVSVVVSGGFLGGWNNRKGLVGFGKDETKFELMWK